MRQLTGRGVPGAAGPGLGPDVGMRSAPKAAMATGDAAVLAAVTSGATLLAGGAGAVCVLRTRVVCGGVHGGGLLDAVT